MLYKNHSPMRAYITQTVNIVAFVSGQEQRFVYASFKKNKWKNLSWNPNLRRVSDQLPGPLKQFHNGKIDFLVSIHSCRERRCSRDVLVNENVERNHLK